MNDFLKGLTAKTAIFSFVLSIVVAWLLIPLSYGFPMVAFFIFFLGLSTLVYAVRKDRSWFDTVLYLGILVLSSFLLIRSNNALQFINFIFIILFGSVFIFPVAREHTIFNLFLTPFSVINHMLTGKNVFPYSSSILKGFNKTSHVKKTIPSILVTILFLAITIPLLSSANPFFNSLTQNVLRFLNLTEVVRFFTGDQPFLYLIRFVIFIFLAYITPRILTAVTNGINSGKIGFSLPINYLLPKVAMGILLVVFFITQAQLYFADSETLQSMGYTNSRLTNEIFFQVTLVAFIIFFLAYLDSERKKWHKILSYFLIVEAFFLVGIAFKSVIDYSLLWGLTQKRLWGYASMTWLSGALIIFLYYYARRVPLQRFFQIAITFTVTILIGINIANFDYLITHHSVARTQSGTDYSYLTRLSPDAAYYKETLENLIVQIETSSSREMEKTFSAQTLFYKIEQLQRKYGNNFPLNSFNFAEYAEYQNVKDINTQAYREKLSEIERKFTEQENPNPQSINEPNSN